MDFLDMEAMGVPESPGLAHRNPPKMPYNSYLYICTLLLTEPRFYSGVLFFCFREVQVYIKHMLSRQILRIRQREVHSWTYPGPPQRRSILNMNCKYHLGNKCQTHATQAGIQRVIFSGIFKFRAKVHYQVVKGSISLLDKLHNQYVANPNRPATPYIPCSTPKKCSVRSYSQHHRMLSEAFKQHVLVVHICLMNRVCRTGCSCTRCTACVQLSK